MKTFLISVVVIITGIVAILSYYGLFTTPVISNKEINPIALVYKKHIGEYKNTGQVMNQIYYQLLNEDNIQTTKGFGIYYDDPKTTDKDSLRSVVGCIIEDKDKIRVADLGSKYNFGEFPASDCIVAEFPYKGKISVIMGVLRYIRNYPTI